MSDDGAIHAILKKILDKWNIENRANVESSAEPVAPVQEKQKTNPVSSLYDLENEKVIPETIIISPDKERGLENRSNMDHPANKDEVLMETVIISSAYDESSKESKPDKTAADNQYIMPETIIISGDNNEKTSESKSHKKDILSGSEAKKTNKQKSDDILAETIILRPDELTDKDKNGK